MASRAWGVMVVVVGASCAPACGGDARVRYCAPHTTQSCACGSASGTQVCANDSHWLECDCSGAGERDGGSETDATMSLVDGSAVDAPMSIDSGPVAIDSG